MLDKRDIIVGIITLLLAFSAILSAISMEYDSKANSELILALIDFNKADYVSAQQSWNSWLITQTSLNENKAIDLQNLFCSISGIYMNTPNPNQQILSDLLNRCLDDLSSLNEYSVTKEIGMNNTKQIQDSYKSLKPLENLNSSFERFLSYSKTAKNYKYGSWFFFLIGFFIFYHHLLKYIFKIK